MGVVSAYWYPAASPPLITERRTDDHFLVDHDGGMETVLLLLLRASMAPFRFVLKDSQIIP